MAEKDLYNSIEQESAFDSAAISTDTTTNGNIIDTQGFDSITFVADASAYTDGTYTLALQEGDASNLSDATSVAAADLLGGAAVAVGAANTPKRLGYKGVKRYVRLQIVSTSTSSGATLHAAAIKGHAVRVPTANN